MCAKLHLHTKYWYTETQNTENTWSQCSEQWLNKFQNVETMVQTVSYQYKIILGVYLISSILFYLSDLHKLPFGFRYNF